MMRAVLASIIALALCLPALAAEPVTLTIYSDRHQEEDKLLFDAFAQETGIKIELIDEEPESLMQRLHDPKSNADLFLSVGVSDLEIAADAGLLRPIARASVIEAVPAPFHDKDRRWVGLDWWARVIAYRKDRFGAEDVTRYEALEDPRFQGQILIRSSSSPYNKALVAAMIDADGAEEAESWAQALVQNLARPPQDGDTGQIEALSQGLGGIAIINTRYWARLAASDKVTESELLDGLGLVFPNQADRGTMIDLFAGAVPRSAKNPDEAERLLDYLLRPDVQQKLSAADLDYPARPRVPVPSALPPVESFKIDSASIAKLGIVMPEADRVIAKAGWE
jgi:iron(III) transport system substrate-binding protein